MTWLQTKQHDNGLTYLEVNTALCQAKIYLQGAQITEFKPSNQASLLWVSSANDYQPGISIRGGIPICWPWFGQSTQENWPAHGFARTKLWHVEASLLEHDIAIITLALSPQEFDCEYWPYKTQIRVKFELGKSLRVSLINQNLDTQAITLTQALHSYFPIDDIHQLKARGFLGSDFIEFAKGPFNQESDTVRFDRETDRVYANLPPVQYLESTQGTIEVRRAQSQSAVLWNPWIEKSKRLSRFLNQDYQQMVCLEAANVREDSITLAPNEQHTLMTEIRWKE
ncbi:D-hexose-6-phosphate mutarotase [Shewanella gelidii]|uniref:Putative glucose-6-phosphate 1-epimerase n=1 Tax=Shewanella gelidii TaxID=1642821 RepID=A0A917JMR2_9GAMM|nr:D-hexose-6-phosphate mutarotase [Shewanella gelidii]MCL1099468.1 D-hexose-6-phosphate mutarotase [Shewanella gelidii]GGI77232.1 D-hexose-6-phosphate mutarotase [Shewanella gelidii]